MLGRRLILHVCVWSPLCVWSPHLVGSRHVRLVRSKTCSEAMLHICTSEPAYRCTVIGSCVAAVAAMWTFNGSLVKSLGNRRRIGHQTWEYRRKTGHHLHLTWYTFRDWSAFRILREVALNCCENPLVAIQQVTSARFTTFDIGGFVYRYRVFTTSASRKMAEEPPRFCYRLSIDAHPEYFHSAVVPARRLDI